MTVADAYRTALLDLIDADPEYRLRADAVESRLAEQQAQARRDLGRAAAERQTIRAGALGLAGRARALADAIGSPAQAPEVADEESLPPQEISRRLGACEASHRELMRRQAELDRLIAVHDADARRTLVDRIGLGVVAAAGIIGAIAAWTAFAAPMLASAPQ